MKTFQPFFVRLNLPYSVKRGEQLGLQVLIFNYLDKEQQVDIELKQPSNATFDLIEKDGKVVDITKQKPDKAYNIRRVKVGESCKNFHDVNLKKCPYAGARRRRIADCVFPNCSE